MNVLECIRARCSVRSYQDREVEEEKLQQILQAARLAPSASNRQEWKFVVVRDADLRRRLVDAAGGQSFVGQAPVVVAACATGTDYIMPCGHPSHLVDLAIAIDHMALAARELDLGSCWVGAFDPEEVREILDIPDSAEVVELLPIGYPVSWPSGKSRKPLDEVVCYDRWE